MEKSNTVVVIYLILFSPNVQVVAMVCNRSYGVLFLDAPVDITNTKGKKNSLDADRENTGNKPVF
jgi:hypothetical protein